MAKKFKVSVKFVVDTDAEGYKQAYVAEKQVEERVKIILRGAGLKVKNLRTRYFRVMKKRPRWLEEDVVETNEYELHDVIAGLRHMHFDCQPRDGNLAVSEIVLKLAKPSHYYVEGYKWNKDGTPVLDKNGEQVVQWRRCEEPMTMTEEDRAELERRVNALIEHMREVDCYLHDVAEYTC